MVGIEMYLRIYVILYLHFPLDQKNPGDKPGMN